MNGGEWGSPPWVAAIAEWLLVVGEGDDVRF